MMQGMLHNFADWQMHAPINMVESEGTILRKRAERVEIWVHCYNLIVQLQLVSFNA